MNTHVSLEGDEYIETFNGEDGDPQGSDTYGIRIGELSIDDIKPEQMVRLAQVIVNHLIVCGHRFELRQLQGEYHDSLEIWKRPVPDMPNIPPPPPKKDAMPINDPNRCLIGGATYVAVDGRGHTRACTGCVEQHNRRMCEMLPDCCAYFPKRA